MRYEAHVTVEPHGELTYEEFVSGCAESGWRASKFDHDDVDGIAGKWFLTHGHNHRATIISELKGMVHGLECSDFTVLRAKVEEVICDTKRGDKIGDFA